MMFFQMDINTLTLLFQKQQSIFKMSFNGKVVIITGSSSGIGQSAAVLFAKHGASVTIHGRSEEGIQKTKDLLKEAGIQEERILAVRGAVDDEKTLKALIDETVKKFGKIDILINNAAIAQKEGIKDQRSMENLDYLLQINFKRCALNKKKQEIQKIIFSSVIHITELAIPHLEKTKGNIINVGSIASQESVPLFPYYSILKAALDHFARNYAAILAPNGVRVNNLNPGYTQTSFGPRHGYADEKIDEIAKGLPLGRRATSEEMAEFLVFMASEKASYMTGQIINVDGGSLIKAPSFKFD